MPPTPQSAPAMERLAKELARVAQERRGQGPNARDAEQLRKSAEEILRNASPEERRRMMDLAREVAKNMPPPTDQQGRNDSPDGRPDRQPTTPSGSRPNPGSGSGSPSESSNPTDPQRESGRPRTGSGPNAGTDRADKPPQDTQPPSGSTPRSDENFGGDVTPREGGVARPRDGDGSGGPPGRAGTRGPSAGQTTAARGARWSGPTELVDARSKDAPGPSRMLAELTSTSDGRGGVDRTADVSGGVREAARGAERAIEDQAVPARHAEFIRRVFTRYLQRTTPAPNITPAPAPAPDAKDVK